jgi:hypothetical protein
MKTLKVHRGQWLRWGTLGLAIATSAIGQTKEQSPRELIAFLTDPNRHVTFRCGLVSADRAAAESLSGIGTVIVPDLERAFDSLQRDGERSQFATGAGWLALAYAKVKGRDAYPRLAFLIADPKLAFVRIDLDQAVALSLGLTSFVSDGRAPANVSCRRAQPRDALDRLILSWAADDPTQFEASLGRDGKAALRLLLKGKNWEAMRAELHRAGPSEGAIGYRFDALGETSEPEETLEVNRKFGDASLTKFDQGIDVAFMSRDGRACGQHRIQFTAERTGTTVGAPSPFPDSYLVNSTDLGDLLRLIDRCF